MLFPPMLEAAARLAAQGHYRQFRKREGDDDCCATTIEDPLPADCIPYITHLMGTMAILARVGASDAVLAAALLHDYLEDVPDPHGAATIRDAVGAEVLALVRAVTEEKRPEQNSEDTWRVRKTEQIQHMAGMEENAVLLKTADLLHNLHSLLTDLEAASDAETVWSRLNAGPEDQIWYFSTMLEEARRRLDGHRLVNDLDRAVDKLRVWIPRPGPAKT
mgnify:CR=1 FL=1